MIRPVQYVVEGLSTPLGASPDDLKLVLSFLLSYPFVAVMMRIPDDRPRLKVIYSICVSAVYLVGLFDLWAGTVELAISAAGAYVIAARLRGPLMPWLGFVFLMGHLAISQLRRQWRDTPDVVDITGAQMVLVLKLGAFCWNVADGRLPAAQLSDFQRDRALPELPPLLDYVGYVFFFPSLFAGPAFDYAEYRRWLDMSMFDGNLSIPAPLPAPATPAGRATAYDPAPVPTAPASSKNRATSSSNRIRRRAGGKLALIPRTDIPAARKAAAGLLWLGLYVQLAPRFPSAALLAPAYGQAGLLRGLGLLYMVGLTARLKYYAVWTLTEGACILAGLGFRGIDTTTGRPSWSRVRNIDPWAVETAQNARAFIAGWNINTNAWLRHYVFVRVTPRGRRPGPAATLLTFVTSAFWHGFYPGYYLAFLLASATVTTAQQLRRAVRPFFLPTAATGLAKRAYDLASLVATQLAFAFVAAPYQVLTLRASVHVWGRVYFCIPLAIAACAAFFASPARVRLQALLDARQTQAVRPEKPSTKEL